MNGNYNLLNCLPKANIYNLPSYRLVNTQTSVEWVTFIPSFYRIKYLCPDKIPFSRKNSSKTNPLKITIGRFLLLFSAAVIKMEHQSRWLDSVSDNTLCKSTFGRLTDHLDQGISENPATKLLSS